MHKRWLAVALLLSGTAAAQRVTVVIKCVKPDQEHSIPAGDKPGHVFSISHTTCTYTKPAPIAGLNPTQGADTVFTEIKDNRLEWNGVYAETYSNGDKIYYAHHGNGTLKDNKFESGKDFYEVTGATGKLKGYKGNGSCSIQGLPDGGAEDECTGEFIKAK